LGENWKNHYFDEKYVTYDFGKQASFAHVFPVDVTWRTRAVNRSHRDPWRSHCNL